MMTSGWKGSHPSSHPFPSDISRSASFIRACRSTGFLILATAVLATIEPASAAYLQVSAPLVRVIPTETVLADFTTSTPDGHLLFVQPSGVTVRFLTDAHDPEISNPGSGSFHPAKTDAVIAALDAIEYPAISGIEADVFILPYPRSGLLSSSASARAIYLSPGVLPYADTHVHFLIAHEIGHCVHRQLLPENDLAGWTEYRHIRGIEDPRYHNGAAHADRPNEIFAEDFRVLFGGPIARGDGNIENGSLPRPDQVPGLYEFFLDLFERAGVDPVQVAAANWNVFPNPLRHESSLLLQADGPIDRTGDLEVELFDAAGRRLLDAAARPVGSRRWMVDFDGRDERGRALPAGAYWIRVVDREAERNGDPPQLTNFRWIP